MGRRGAYKGPRNWQQGGEGRFSGNQFNNNDKADRADRKVETGRDRRRVSFKTTGAGAPGRFNNMNKGGYTAELAIRTRLEEDEDMVDFPQNRSGEGTFRSGGGGRGGPRMRRRGSPIPKGGHGPPGNKKLIAGTSGWFKVTIPHGQKYDKQQIMKPLMHAVQPHIFIPHYFKMEPSAITFFVDDIRVAEILLNADRQFNMPDGFRMLIRVRNSIPHVQIDENFKQKIKMAMVKRYTATTKALDLTKFHADEDLKDIFCALFRPTIMLSAIDVIAENIPDLEALNLSDNKIYLLDHLKCLATKLPYMKILHLANNKITSTNSLDALRESQLVELVLEGNPFKERMRDKSVYVSEILKRFPKLTKLDGVELPPQIGFDVGDDTKMPTPKASFLCNQSASPIIRQFLEEYFKIYDSSSRQPLLEAYDENAMFSLTTTYNQIPSLRLTSYLPHNRNITRIRDLDTRCRLLKSGRLPVVSFLTELPATQHDPQSFAVDLTLCPPQAHFILVIVTGIFKEKSRPNDSLRSFQKCLTIVEKPNGGFCIRNELLTITNVTPSQSRLAFKTPAAIPAVVEPPAVAVAVPPQTLDDATKMQMVQAMVQHSHMNIEWSTKCLQETQWDFNHAAFVFTELHKQNKIPPEAFVK